MCGTVTCDACGGVSGNSRGGGTSGGGSCDLTLDVTVCNGAGNFPLKLLLALIPGDFKFISGHLRENRVGALHFLGSISKLLLYR